MTPHRPRKISEAQIEHVREELQAGREILHGMLSGRSNLDDAGELMSSLHRTLHSRPAMQTGTKAAKTR
jgi:small ligand-binding sensory domain FIST